MRPTCSTVSFPTNGTTVYTKKNIDGSIYKYVLKPDRTIYEGFIDPDGVRYVTKIPPKDTSKMTIFTLKKDSQGKFSYSKYICQNSRDAQAYAQNIITEIEEGSARVKIFKPKKDLCELFVDKLKSQMKALKAKKKNPSFDELVETSCKTFKLFMKFLLAISKK